MNYRKALINAALCGWKGDSPCGWPSPADLETILAWGASYCTGGIKGEKLLPAFKELVKIGLFFEVHSGLFKVPCYYCSYETKLLSEITDDENIFELWDDWVEEFDHEQDMKWRKFGLCDGQGRQGPSGGPWGPCLGPECCWFMDGKQTCNWELEFARNE